MDLFKKHYEAAAVIVTIVGAAMWMTSSISNLQLEMNARFASVDKHFFTIENRLTKIETVLIMIGIMPNEMAKDVTPKCTGWRPYEDYIPKHDSRAIKDTEQGK